MSTPSAAAQVDESSRPAHPYVAVANGRRLFASDVAVSNLERTIHTAVQHTSLRRPYAWEPNEDSLRAFIAKFLTTPKVREKKDGRCYVPGRIVGDKRNKGAVAHLDMMVFDLDRSKPEEIMRVLAEIDADGLAYFFHTTFSHLTTETEVSFDKYRDFARGNGLDPSGDECARRYLREKKKYDDDATNDSRVVEAARQTADGAMVVLSHAPMHKYRLILVLDRPFVIAEWLEKGFSENDVRTRLWDAALEIVAREYGLSYDTTCTDISRAFYPTGCPDERRGEANSGGQFGKALRLDAVVPANPEALDAIVPKVKAKPGAKAARSQRQGSTAGPARAAVIEYEGRNVVGWCGEFGRSYELETALRGHVPDDKFRTPRSEGGTHMECPYEEGHTTAGGTGFFAVNASDNGEYGFGIHCSHASCQTERGRGRGVDRAVYIAQFLRLGWLTLEDLENPELGGGPVPWLKPTKGAIRAMIDKLDTAATSDDLDPVIDALARYGDRVFDAEALRLIEDKTGQKNRTALGDAIKARRRDQRAARDEAARPVFEKAKRGLRAREYEVLAFEDWKTLGTLADITDRAFEHLCQQKADIAKAHEVELFNHASQQAELRERRGRKEVTPLTRDTLTKHIGDCTHWTVPRDSPPFEQVASVPPAAVVRILASSSESLPPLRYLAHSAFFDPQGRLVVDAGYHPKCAAYLTTSLDVDVPEVPSAEAVTAALNFLFREVFEGFPFDDGNGKKEAEASRAHLLAMLLQPFMRLMIDGPCPIYGVMKPAAGTGGTLLVEAVSLIAFGRSADVSPEPKGTEGDWFKDILSHVAKGSEMAFYDNLHRTVKDDAFASAITAPVIVGRQLGTNKHIEGPMLGLWVLCANNLQVSSEIARRILPIRLDTGTPDPKVGRDFRHPQLREWIRANRSDLVRACLVLIQNWIATGKKPWTGKPLVSFEAYSAAMGGVLEAAGVKGFLGNTHLLAEGGEDATLQAFVERWWKTFEDAWRDVGAIGSGEPILTVPPQDLVHLYEASGIKFWFHDKHPRHEWHVKLHYVLRSKSDTTWDIEGVRVKLKQKRANSGKVYMLERQLKQKTAAAGGESGDMTVGRV